MEPGGIEPHENQTGAVAKTDSHTPRATGRATGTRQTALQEVIAAWPDLQGHEKSAIVTIVRASSSCEYHSSQREPESPRDSDGRRGARKGIKSTAGRDAGADAQTPDSSAGRSRGGAVDRLGRKNRGVS